MKNLVIMLVLTLSAFAQASTASEEAMKKLNEKIAARANANNKTQETLTMIQTLNATIQALNASLQTKTQALNVSLQLIAKNITDMSAVQDQIIDALP